MDFAIRHTTPARIRNPEKITKKGDSSIESWIYHKTSAAQPPGSTPHWWNPICGHWIWWQPNNGAIAFVNLNLKMDTPMGQGERDEPWEAKNAFFFSFFGFSFGEKKRKLGLLKKKKIQTSRFSLRWWILVPAASVWWGKVANGIDIELPQTILNPNFTPCHLPFSFPSLNIISLLENFQITLFPN